MCKSTGDYDRCVQDLVLADCFLRKLRVDLLLLLCRHSVLLAPALEESKVNLSLLFINPFRTFKFRIFFRFHTLLLNLAFCHIPIEILKLVP